MDEKDIKAELDIRDEQIDALIEVAGMAKEKAQAPCSCYKVGAALFLDNGRIVSGFNVEYGNGYGRAETRAVHAEESAIVEAIRKYGRPKINMVAVVGPNNQPIAPCGNCLDVLKTYSTPETLFVIGDEEMDLLTFEQMMPSEFPKREVKDLSPMQRLMLNEASRFREFGFDPFSRLSIGRQGCVVRTRGDNLYGGVREDNAAYHPISAVESAIVNAHCHLDPYLEALAIVCDTGSLCGKDRQIIFEKADELDKHGNLEVIIKPTYLDEVMIARPRDLLPYGFGASDIGMKEETGAYLERFNTWREEHGLIRKIKE
ncbi:cytidine deaminase [Thermoproteota archaeon]